MFFFIKTPINDSAKGDILVGFSQCARNSSIDKFLLGCNVVELNQAGRTSSGLPIEADRANWLLLKCNANFWGDLRIHIPRIPLMRTSRPAMVKDLGGCLAGHSPAMGGAGLGYFDRFDWCWRSRWDKLTIFWPFL